MKTTASGLALAGVLAALIACGDDDATRAQHAFQQHLGAAHTEVDRHHRASMDAGDMAAMMTELGAHEGAMSGHMQGMHAQMPMMQGCGGMGMMDMEGMGGMHEGAGMGQMGMDGMMHDAEAMMGQHREELEAAPDLAAAHAACTTHTEHMTEMLGVMAEHLDTMRCE